ncbi:ABC transporter permease [Nesterenkonia sp. K-15-9-6]|uniref:ABC transporter permease n=1 Tax=Nesterenkonia sp. K-15-9-6 TaxID=3093918 RepID=UPI0040449E43
MNTRETNSPGDEEPRPDHQAADHDARMGEQMVDLTEVEDAKLARKEHSYSQGQLVRRRFFSHRPAVISLVVLGATAILAFSSIGFAGIPGWWDKHYMSTGSIIDGGRPMILQDGNILGEHPFGQENVGRDYFAMVMRGTQQSLTIAFVVAIVSSLIGILVGALAGYFRGRLEAVLMRITDFVIVVPLVVIAAILGQVVSGLPGGVVPLAVVLGTVTWTGMARLVRAEVLTLREKEFVAAAIAMGGSPARIILKHMLPNSIGVIIVNATFSIAAAILLETSLSYLGMGVQRPDVSLGLLIQQYESAFTVRPWLFWFPGIFIIVIAMCVNFIGDGLRDAFDPRQQRVGDRRPTLLSALGLTGMQRALRARTEGARQAAGGPGSERVPAGAQDPRGNPMQWRRKK